MTRISRSGGARKAAPRQNGCRQARKETAYRLGCARYREVGVPKSLHGCARRVHSLFSNVFWGTGYERKNSDQEKKSEKKNQRRKKSWGATPYDTTRFFGGNATVSSALLLSSVCSLDHMRYYSLPEHKKNCNSELAKSQHRSQSTLARAVCIGTEAGPWGDGPFLSGEGFVRVSL